MLTLLSPLPFFFVNKEVVTARVQKFLDEKHPVLSSAISKQDTKSIWYTLEHIEKLLDEMKHVEANGVRIYMGMYEDDHETSPQQLCLLMVPTRYNADTQKIEDVVAEDEPDFLQRQEAPKAAPDWTLNGLTIQQGQAMNYNFGAACPPVCNYIMEYKFPH